jgi:DNA-binding CsgD family transcriptional regulator
MTEDERTAIHQLWDTLADFPVSQVDEALTHLMKGICELIGAGNAYWLGYIRFNVDGGDPLNGLRPGLPPGANRYLYPAPIHIDSSRSQTVQWNRQHVNEGYLLAARDVGQFRSFRLRQEMRTEYFEEPFYQTFHASRGFHDQCVVFFPVNQDYESMFNFLRVGEERDFTPAEEAIAAYALRGIKAFHRQLALSYGLLIAERPLTDLQRRVTSLLLTDRTEKQIADELAKPVSATHKHVTEIFRKFGVNSRAGLMSLWLGQKV